MSTSVDQSFIKEFQAMVHEEYQRQGSKLRNLVRTQNNVQGASTVFQKVGKGKASTKARHGDVPVMNIDHTPVECTLADYYAGDFVDKLDTLKLNIDEMQITARAGAFALGRKTDDLILRAAETSSWTTITGADYATNGLALTECLKITEEFGNKDVPEDDDRYAVVGWKQWSQLLGMTEFSNADYIGPSELPFKSMTAKRWAGFMWMPMSNSDGGLADDGTNTKCVFFHRTALGHASGLDVTTDITWQGTKASHFVNNMMSQGAVAIDESALFVPSVKN